MDNQFVAEFTKMILFSLLKTGLIIPAIGLLYCMVAGKRW